MNLTVTFWAVLGLVLIITEVLSLTFVLLFFGVSALLIAGAKLFGLNNAAVEMALFGVIGIGGLLIFRKKLKDALSSRKGMQIDRENVVILSAPVPPRGRAQIQYQGTTWTAINQSDVALNAGDEVRISSTEGIKLIIQPKSKPAN
jgi:membrane protein implicated in regulation of membrane protease activity